MCFSGGTICFPFFLPILVPPPVLSIWSFSALNYSLVLFGLLMNEYAPIYNFSFFAIPFAPFIIIPKPWRIRQHDTGFHFPFVVFAATCDESSGVFLIRRPANPLAATWCGSGGRCLSGRRSRDGLWGSSGRGIGVRRPAWDRQKQEQRNRKYRCEAERSEQDHD